MSKVRITLTTQPKDGGQINYGILQLELHSYGEVYSIGLALHPIGGYARFTEVLWFSPQADADWAQTQTYVLGINQTYKSVLGTNNIGAYIDGVDAVVEAKVGTFHNGAYTGDILQTVNFVYENTVQPPQKLFTYEDTGNGDCTNEEYQVLSADGGTAPYRLTLDGSDVVSGWDGATPTVFNLERAKTYSGGLYDSTNALIELVSINPTKKLKSTDFTTEVIPYIGYSDLKVVRKVTRVGTDPLEYNLINSIGGESGWQTSNIFGGTPQGNYTLEVRDKYLCEVSKVIVVASITSILELNREDYFKVSEYNSLSYFNVTEHSDEVRKTYDNTPSYKENVRLPRNGFFSFPEGSMIKNQFKSSYSHHVVELHRVGLSTLTLNFTQIQTNLGVTEKVDCEIFPAQVVIENIDGTSTTINNGSGIYFNGGNQYEPNTTDPLPDPVSPYTSGLPGWAQVGNQVSIDGLGVFEVKETDLYDASRDVVYFRIDAILTEQTAKIQSTWDRHPYNVFRFDFPMSHVSEKGAYVRIEPGVEEAGLLLVDANRIHCSEWFTKITDTSNYLKCEWMAFRNIGEMLFIDGITCEMWVKGRIRPFSSSSAEFDDGDDRARSLDQEAYLRMRAFMPLLSVRQWRKLDLVGAIGSRGVVHIEGMELIRINATEVEEQGVTNRSNVTIEFAFAGESTAVGQEDPVYDIETGGTKQASTGKEPVSGWEADNFRLITEEGEFVKVVDDGQEKYVEID